MTSPLHRDTHHESAWRHVTGEAQYIDDLPEPTDLLVAVLVTSPHAHARVLTREADAALDVPGVATVLFADHIPGDNLIGAIAHDEPLLADEEVLYVGHPVAVVFGESYAACREGARKVVITYEPLESVLSIEDAIDKESFSYGPHVIQRGEAEAVFAKAPVQVIAEVHSGGQDHLYLETQTALALPLEDGNFHIFSSTQHPSEAQKLAALVLGIPSSKVVCTSPRMGGAFGGKESQGSAFACLAALGAWYTRRPVKVWLDRDTDMQITGKRHPCLSRYEAGFDRDGQLLSLKVHAYADGGYSLDLSGPILDRTMFHLDNCYFIGDLRFEGRVCRTNLASNTAFRGFGGPQGMLVVEDAINRASELLRLDPAEVRRRNYYGDAPRNLAPYGQEVDNPRCERIHSEILASSEYATRRKTIEKFNSFFDHVKRGIGLQPVKFGISFTKALLNQAGALVLVYADGSVQLNHGGTEMGQGLYTKMTAVCAHELGVSTEAIRHMATSTDKVPNTSPTAASSGSDLNGQAVKDACLQIRKRMRPVAAEMLGIGELDAALLEFANDSIRVPGREDAAVSFAEVATQCWLRRISLSANGFYATPGIAYDHESGSGRPFFYYAYGAAVIEVEVNGLTGEHRLRRVDILHDAGSSLIPSIDIGQVEGGFVQGVGWLTTEELVHGEAGQVLTHGPSTYKIPAVGDVPEEMNVALLEHAEQPGVIHGSKAVGEPPFMLAIGVITALRHAIGGFGAEGTEVELALPATPEAVLRAVTEMKRRSTFDEATEETSLPSGAS